MQFKYNLEDRPPAGELLLFALQWFAVAVPTIIIIGKISASLTNPGEEILYLQKLTFVMGAALLAQVLAGHGYPLIIGPSTVLLVGIITGGRAGAATVYSSILIGGILLSAISITHCFAYLKRFFTPRVVAVVLLLIAFTLAPTIMNLIMPARTATPPLPNFIFALALISLMFFFYARLTGIWKSTLIIWSMLGGGVLYYLIFPADPGMAGPAPLVAGIFHETLPEISLDPSVLFAFLFCFIALSINDLGSIQSLNDMLNPPDQAGRITRGILVTGLANIVSGFLSVIGPVNFSLSPGVIVSTGCASRWPLLPAGALLCLLAFSPAALSFMGSVPGVVIGAVLLFILCSQVAAGLVLFLESGGDRFEGGLVVGLPVMLGAIVAFLPAATLDTFPTPLRPILGNGFVMGVSAALLLEHGVFRHKVPKTPPLI